METPDKWVIVKIEKEGEETIYKVLASWYGGYLGADSWRLNSGIAEVKEDDNFYYFYGYSGSCYRCHKNTYGTHMLSNGVYDNTAEDAKKVGVNLEILPEETVWGDIFNIKPYNESTEQN